MEAVLTWLRLYRTFYHRAGLCQVPSKKGTCTVREFISSWAPVRNKELQFQPLENCVFEDRFFS